MTETLTRPPEPEIVNEAGHINHNAEHRDREPTEKTTVDLNIIRTKYREDPEFRQEFKENCGNSARFTTVDKDGMPHYQFFYDMQNLDPEKIVTLLRGMEGEGEGQRIQPPAEGFYESLKDGRYQGFVYDQDTQTIQGIIQGEELTDAVGADNTVAGVRYTISMDGVLTMQPVPEEAKVERYHTRHGHDKPTEVLEAETGNPQVIEPLRVSEASAEVEDQKEAVEVGDEFVRKIDRQRFRVNKVDEGRVVLMNAEGVISPSSVEETLQEDGPWERVSREGGAEDTSSSTRSGKGASERNDDNQPNEAPPTPERYIQPNFAVGEIVRATDIGHFFIVTRVGEDGGLRLTTIEGNSEDITADEAKQLKLMHKEAGESFINPDEVEQLYSEDQPMRVVVKYGLNISSGELRKGSEGLEFVNSLGEGYDFNQILENGAIIYVEGPPGSLRIVSNPESDEA